MKVFYSDRYTIPLPPQHKFPMEKYAGIRSQLLENNVLNINEMHEAPTASYHDVVVAHSNQYVDAVFSNTLDDKSIRKIGFPRTELLLGRSLATVGGASASALEAINNGFSGNLAGGTHHAHYDSGEGFCVFNDFAVTALNLLKKKIVKRIGILDLDVHQGNGNASILGDVHNVYILDMYCEKNYPFHKILPNHPVPLSTECTDEEFLDLLTINIVKMMEFKPDIIFYQHGSDMLAEDSLGKMKLSLEGLKNRDEIVFDFCKKNGIPLSLGQGGGYSKPISITIQAHVNTYQLAKSYFS